ncbi:MAG: hypothetical protein GVY12_05345 [Bacteroidetes bacterium]|nr:hypothetical protein [Bacteroidota bacterium]
MVKDEAVVLQENLAFLADFSGLAPLPDGGFVVTTTGGRTGGSDAAAVVVYSADGRQERVLGRPGQGPHEYQQPRLVATQGERILIWDQAQRKVSAFAIDGTPLDEWTGLSALSGLTATSVQLALFGLGSADEGLIRLYDTNTDSFTCRTGAYTPADLMLMRVQVPVGLTTYEGDVLYAAPSRPVVHRLQPGTCEEDTLPFDVPGFSVEETEGYPPNSMEALEYAWLNSRIVGLHPVSRYLVIEALLELEGDRLLLVFDENFVHLDTIRYERSTEAPVSRHVDIADGQRLGFVTQEEANGEVHRVLHWWRVQTVD